MHLGSELGVNIRGASRGLQVDAPPWKYAPPHPGSMRQKIDGQQAGGMHPTGMHPCNVFCVCTNSDETETEEMDTDPRGNLCWYLSLSSVNT